MQRAALKVGSKDEPKVDSTVERKAAYSAEHWAARSVAMKAWNSVDLLAVRSAGAKVER